jgi:para-nitrobenzyl esterase
MLGLPVMVYVFGGGLCTGYNHNPQVDGAALSSTPGRRALVITVSYRLGALGFLPSIPGAFDTPTDAVPDRGVAINAVPKFLPLSGRGGVGGAETRGGGGMNGIYDVIVALRWLQSNLPAFGGDPDRVMLFGQSSGSYAVCTLCVSHVRCPSFTEMFG